MEKQVMKLTKEQIKQIIKEEIETVMKELEGDALDEDAAAEKELQDALAQPMHK